MCKEFEISALAGRLAREVAEAKQALEHVENGVCLFGGARVKPGTTPYEEAYKTGRLLSQEGIPVITGGGPGIMEAGNKGAQAGLNGRSIGLNIRLPHEQTNNPYQDIELSFNHFASRKVMFCRQARAYVFFAGGVGTLDELGEVLTLIQTGKSARVPVILYGTEFWRGLVAWMRSSMLENQLVKAEDIDALKFADTPEEVLALIASQVDLEPAA